MYTTADRLLEYMDLETPDAETTRSLGALIERVSGLLDEQLHFSFGGEVITELLDGSLDPYLWLPAPGAKSVSSVVENGVPLVKDTDYLRDPTLGLYLLRLSSTGQRSSWLGLERSITVVYAPNAAPPALEEVCLEECVRRWQGRAAGYPDVVGTGAEARRYTRKFDAGTLEILASLRRQYAVRDTVAM